MPVLLLSLIVCLSDLYSPLQQLNPFPQIKNTVSTDLFLLSSGIDNDISWILEYSISNQSAWWINPVLGDILRRDGSVNDFRRWGFGSGYIQQRPSLHWGVYGYFDYSDRSNGPPEPLHMRYRYKNKTINFGGEIGKKNCRLVANFYKSFIKTIYNTSTVYGVIYPNWGLDIKLTGRYKFFTAGVGGCFEHLIVTGAELDRCPPMKDTIRDIFIEGALHIIKLYEVRVRCLLNQGELSLKVQRTNGSDTTLHKPVDRHLLVSYYR